MGSMEVSEVLNREEETGYGFGVPLALRRHFIHITKNHYHEDVCLDAARFTFTHVAEMLERGDKIGGPVTVTEVNDLDVINARWFEEDEIYVRVKLDNGVVDGEMTATAHITTVDGEKLYASAGLLLDVVIPGGNR